MGNSHSQHHQLPISQWTHSYPRTRHPQPQVKVLPQRVPPLQLRTTDNGAILQNGGTISGRKPGAGQEERIYRPRSSSAHRPPKLEEITLDKNRFGSEPDLRFHLKESKDQFSENAVRQRISRSRKKYKAPSAPQNGLSSGMESSSPDLNGWETNPKDYTGAPVRKTRLFKTRAESSKKNLSSVKPPEKEESELTRSMEALNILKPKFKEERLQQNVDRIEKKGLKRSVSHEVISNKGLATPEFQAELLEAAQRLRPPSGIKIRESQIPGKPAFAKLSSKEPPPKEVLSSLNIEIPNDDFKSNQSFVKGREETGQENQRSEKAACGDLKREKVERDVPSKKFYFGMKENGGDIRTVNTCVSASTNNVDKTNAEHRITAVEKSKNLMNLYKMVGEGGREWEDTIDKFAANFHKNQVTMSNGNTTSCSSSFISDPDEDVDGGIALQLRPTLPKKQLEIPRFSPTAAWRQLSSIETACSQAPSPGGSDDGPLLLEDRIHHPVQQQGLRGSHDKSGDSGISGDASPGGCHESSSEIAATSPKGTPANNSKNILMAWTPQQDLEEESSSDDLESPLSSSKNVVCNIAGAKFSPRGQLFLSRDQSFSVPPPREERISRYNVNGDFKDRGSTDIPPRLNSLKKFKVTLSNSKRDAEEPTPTNDNWVLSRSVPSSLNNSHVAVTRSVSNPSSPEQDEEYCQQASLKYPSYSYLANGGRMMYLPEYHSRMSPDLAGKKSRGNMMCNGFLSKSCENITQPEMKQVGRSRSPSPLVTRAKELQSDGIRPNQKKKKFTFQSTVRLLENKRIAERLSREAEFKENQRLSELEAMKKVEEEFQKKRAREKANIRHQLRLFSLEEKNYSSLPPIEWDENKVDTEEAPSSLPPSGQGAHRKFSVNKKSSIVEINKFAPTTQVLSEFREPMRDYRDYRHSRYHEPQEFMQETVNRRSIVEHPRVVYDMPKSTAVYVSAPANPTAQNQHKEENRVGLSTPRSSTSDNYRKNFAHGALATSGRSLTSSDSELSQSHPHFGSRQGVTTRGFGPLHRSRSASPESITESRSSLRGFECSFPRSRSASPAKIILSQKSRSISPNHIPPLENEASFLRDSPTRGNARERKFSNPNEYKSAAKNRQIVNIEENSNTQEPLAKGTTDSLLRFKLPSLQPFNKAEKSFRPINFNPANKVAQTVT